MPSITLHNVPDPVYAELRERASRNGTTVENEAINCIGAGLAESRDVEHVLADLDEFRASLGGIYATEEELRRAKREGRP